MNIEQVFNIIFDKNHWQKTPVTCFTGNLYPYQFIIKCLSILESEQYLPVTRSRMQISNQDAKTLLPLLQQTILGQASFFWLGDVDENFTQKQSALIIESLSKYSGENRIALFAREVGQKNLMVEIQLPSEIILDEGIEVVKFFFPKILNNKQKLLAIEQLFNQSKKLPLNLFITIMDNFELVHSKNLDLLLEYLGPSLPFNGELSLLSQAFFKRDRLFFKHWQELSKIYPPVFWLVFWGDQWWRAFHLITFALHKNIILAKKMGFKLPYSFVTKEWQTYSPEYFQNLLAKLYVVDYNIKQGSTFCFFDVIHAQHFTFKKK